jgi:hypothetical protein
MRAEQDVELKVLRGKIAATRALKNFRAGDRVGLARARHPELLGATGTVRRVVKSRRALVVDLDDGRTYRACPLKTDKLDGGV